MSRSAEDWARERRRLIEARTNLFTAGDLLSDVSPGYLDTDELGDLQQETEAAILHAVKLLNSAIGAVTPGWLVD